jgi:hypothetical protein
MSSDDPRFDESIHASDEPLPRLKWYVGFLRDGSSAQAFPSRFTPTEDSHQKLYWACWGPFRTERAALFAAKGSNYKRFDSVRDVENYLMRTNNEEYLRRDDES